MVSRRKIWPKSKQRGDKVSSFTEIFGIRHLGSMESLWNSGLGDQRKMHVRQSCLQGRLCWFPALILPLCSTPMFSVIGAILDYSAFNSYLRTISSGHSIYHDWPTQLVVLANSYSWGVWLGRGENEDWPLVMYRGWCWKAYPSLR